MIVIGLLGGSGVGKSTIARLLVERLSAHRVGHIDADAIAHELLDGGGDGTGGRTDGTSGGGEADGKSAGGRGGGSTVKQRLVERFGDRILTGGGGTIDRKKLGALVFGDDQALRDLNAIIHPAVVAACRERIDEFKRSGKKVVIVDAALLLDVPGSTAAMGISHTIALQAAREEQIRRLVEKGGAAEDEIRARLDNQIHLEKSFYMADDVVDTNRPLSEVFDDVLSIVERLLRNDLQQNGDVDRG